MMKKIKEIYDFRPWYHDFGALGVQTNFHPEKRFGLIGKKVPQNCRSMKQQPRKESAITPYIHKVLDCVSSKDSLSILDLFCSDGYYGFFAQKHCKTAMLTGVDKNKKDIDRCRIISHHLNFGQTTFVCDDVYNYVETAKQFDVILCFGGLYHLSEPWRLLKSLRKITGQYLIVQSAITVEHDNPEYFETPNPWFRTWGSLFTNSKLLQMVQDAGFKVMANVTNKRKEPNPKYIGASYILLIP